MKICLCRSRTTRKTSQTSSLTLHSCCLSTLLHLAKTESRGACPSCTPMASQEHKSFEREALGGSLLTRWSEDIPQLPVGSRLYIGKKATLAKMKPPCIDPRTVLENTRTCTHQLSPSSEEREEKKSTRSVILPAPAQPPLHPPAWIAAALYLTHIVEDKIYVAVIISFEDIHEANDILMSCQFLEEHDFSERPLSIRSILKGIKDLFQRHSLICAPVRALPHNAICLTKKQTNKRMNSHMLVVTHNHRLPGTNRKLYKTDSHRNNARKGRGTQTCREPRSKNAEKPFPALTQRHSLLSLHARTARYVGMRVSQTSVYRNDLKEDALRRISGARASTAPATTCRYFTFTEERYIDRPCAIEIYPTLNNSPPALLKSGDLVEMTSLISTHVPSASTTSARLRERSAERRCFSISLHR